MTTTLATVGSLAPDFTLPCTPQPDADRNEVSLADYRGRWLTLLFYPRDFSLVCPTELTAVSHRLAEFQRQGCEVLGISTDTVESHLRWLSSPRSQGGLGGLNFPLASDLDGSVCRAYNVLIPWQKVAMRGLFIIDPNGVLQYQVVHNLSVGRRVEEVLRVLAGLQSGGLCPENWSRAEDTLDPTRTLGPGSMLSQYRIEELIGSGTFAAVYRAQDTILQRTVAIKVLRPQAGARPDAALTEARAAAALNHPNICTIYAVDASEGVSLIAMEYVPGRPLSKHLENGALPLDLAAMIGRQVAQGMAAAHAQGVIHGDLKPGNILLSVVSRPLSVAGEASDHLTTDDGQLTTVKIMDFGLARRDPRLTNPDETADYTPDDGAGISGTPSYMSPEQAQGKPVLPASDVFSFGLMLYEMVTGKRAVCGDNVLTVLRRIASLEAGQYAAKVPKPFDHVLCRALSLDPARRLAMAEIAEVLG
jgi:alkyl hydroperoxide reductase subunit AhpC